jgi:hypothetical protein
MTFDSFQKGVDAHMSGWAKDLKNVKDSFKGNAYMSDFMLDMEQIHFEKIKPQDIGGVAKNIGQTATKHGIDIGRNFVTKFLKTVDPTGGFLVTGAEMMIDWGAEMLYSNMWGESLSYDVGDLVVVLKDNVGLKGGLRRRLPSNEVMEAAVVTDKPGGDGIVEVLTIPARVAKHVNVHAVKKVTKEVAAQNAGLYNIEEVLHEIGANEPKQITFQAGDRVSFLNDIYTIAEVLSQEKKCTIESSEGSLQTVDMEDLVACFNKSWGHIFQGQMVWIDCTDEPNMAKGFKYEAAMVHSVNGKTKQIELFTLLGGMRRTMPAWLVYHSDLKQKNFPRFSFAISRPIPGDAEERALYVERIRAAKAQGEQLDQVLRMNIEAKPLSEIPELYVNVRKQFFGLESVDSLDDRLRDVYGNQKYPTFVPDEDHKVEQDRIDHGTSNHTTVLIVGVAGVILFLIFKK